MKSSVVSLRVGGKKAKFNLKKFSPYLYILPMFLFLIMFLLVPFITAVEKSFFKYDIISVNQFIGLDNYITLFTKDAKFWISIRNLLVLFVGMLICFQFPLMAAKLTLMVTKSRLQYLFRTLFIIPIAVPSVVTLLMWRFIYYPEVGVLSRILSVFNINMPNVLGVTGYVMPAIILIGFPWVAGIVYIIIYSAFQGVDTSLIEASEIDGANGWIVFFKIEIPLIMPQIKALLVLAVIGLVQDYERFLILTDGGPRNASLVPGLHMYHMGFGNGDNQFGYACAIAVVLFIITLSVSVLLMRRKKGGEL